MKIADVVQHAYAMPLTSPSFPPGPYRFFNREYIVVTYRTTREALEAVVPEPLEIDEPLVKYEFIRMPDSTGFGDYTESGQVIPVRYAGERGAYVHSMYLDDHAPIAGGRELWGFPKKLASPKIRHEGDVVVGTLHYGSVLCATGTRTRFASRRRASSAAISGSKPFPARFANGMLSGSMQAANSRGDGAAPVASNAAAVSRLTRKREDIELPALAGEVLQVAYRAAPADRRGLVSRIEIGGNDRASPSADA